MITSDQFPPLGSNPTIPETTSEPVGPTYATIAGSSTQRHAVKAVPLANETGDSI